eukprot:CAMPEP_0170912460 /NCGR_PEP_ID=MMETSP0735-20130129/4355_1 /TAXON_ID=186038 /ORGANISM="Fragilariopsis kerguelensis, Strain L26-C5" /LENGTH=336 /DNA_ID=CAMNT_0011309661 /DNA_START=119 /DNA_END=1129 /DNA_ORIENTATION=-
MTIQQRRSCSPPDETKKKGSSRVSFNSSGDEYFEIPARSTKFMTDNTYDNTNTHTLMKKLATEFMAENKMIKKPACCRTSSSGTTSCSNNKCQFDMKKARAEAYVRRHKKLRSNVSSRKSAVVSTAIIVLTVMMFNYSFVKSFLSVLFPASTMFVEGFVVATTTQQRATSDVLLPFSPFSIDSSSSSTSTSSSSSSSLRMIGKSINDEDDDDVNILDREDDQQQQQQQKLIGDNVESVFSGKSKMKRPVEPTDPTLKDRVDALFDQPFFDPNQYDDDDTSLIGKLASLVKSDPDLMKGLFAGVYFLILVVIAQDLLRVQMYNNAAQSMNGNGQGLF